MHFHAPPPLSRCTLLAVNPALSRTLLVLNAVAHRVMTPLTASPGGPAWRGRQEKAQGGDKVGGGKGPNARNLNTSGAWMSASGQLSKEWISLYRKDFKGKATGRFSPAVPAAPRTPAAAPDARMQNGVPPAEALPTPVAERLRPLPVAAPPAAPPALHPSLHPAHPQHNPPQRAAPLPSPSGGASGSVRGEFARPVSAPRDPRHGSAQVLPAPAPPRTHPDTHPHRPGSAAVCPLLSSSLLPPFAVDLCAPARR